MRNWDLPKDKQPTYRYGKKTAAKKPDVTSTIEDPAPSTATRPGRKKAGKKKGKRSGMQQMSREGVRARVQARTGKKAGKKKPTSRKQRSSY